MKLFSKDTLILNQFNYFRKLLNLALDKKMALKKSPFKFEKHLFIKYPFIPMLEEEISKNNNKIDQINSMSVILNDFFVEEWKKNSQNSLKLKKDLEKDLDQIMFYVYDQNENNEIVLHKPQNDIRTAEILDKTVNYEKNYSEFLLKIKEFEFYDKKTNSFELTSFKTINKRSLPLRHAYLILIIFWFEEIVLEKTYIDKLESKYLNEINNLFLGEKQISKQNWRYFKQENISDFKINDLKETKFYKELLKFYKEDIVK